ncbi:MAG: cytochrome P450 [Nitriliruptoraceae bacterium]
MPRAFTAPRPASYAPIPPPVRASDVPFPLPPGPRRSVPVVDLARFLADTPGYLLGLQRRYGDAVAFELRGQLFLGLFAPQHVDEVLVRRTRSFVKGVGFARMRKVLGEGLLTNEEPIHLRHRRLLQAPFHRSRLEGYAATMAASTAEELATWRDGHTVALGPRMMALTLDIVARTLFGTDARASTDRIAHHMGVAIDRIERTMLPGLDRLDHLPLPWFRAFRRAADELAEVAETLIAQRRATDPEGERTDDLLGLLLALRDDDGTALTDDEVRDEVLTLILSGHETTANVLTWAPCYLATAPEVRAALEAEADACAWLTEGRAPRVDEVLAAEVAGHVLRETMRLAPPVWVAPRIALEDLDLDGIRVPRGAHVLVSQYVTHRDPRWYPDPERFDPWRWERTPEQALPRGAYVPFGGGNRRCLGEHFAWLEARIILLSLTRACRLEPRDARRALPAPQPRATFRPRGAVERRVHRRDGN